MSLERCNCVHYYHFHSQLVPYIHHPVCAKTCLQIPFKFFPSHVKPMPLNSRLPYPGKRTDNPSYLCPSWFYKVHPSTPFAVAHPIQSLPIPRVLPSWQCLCEYFLHHLQSRPSRNMTTRMAHDVLSVDSPITLIVVMWHPTSCSSCFI